MSTAKAYPGKTTRRVRKRCQKEFLLGKEVKEDFFRTRGGLNLTFPSFKEARGNFLVSKNWKEKMSSFLFEVLHIPRRGREEGLLFLNQRTRGYGTEVKEMGAVLLLCGNSSSPLFKKGGGGGERGGRAIPFYTARRVKRKGMSYHQDSLFRGDFCGRKKFPLSSAGKRKEV